MNDKQLAAIVAATGASFAKAAFEMGVELGELRAELKATKAVFEQLTEELVSK